MAYLNSENIKVFPSIGRNPEIDLNAELTNEKNLTQILRSIYKRDSFVISNEYSSENSFEFVIQGYYFNVSGVDITAEVTNAEDVYAKIIVVESSEGETLFQQLRNMQDPSIKSALKLDQKNNTAYQFQGVSFTPDDLSESEQSGNYYSLHILTKNGDGWVVPPESKLHWKTSEILDGNSSTSIDNTLTTSTLNATTVNISSYLAAPEGNINTLTTSTLNATLSLNLSGDVSGDGSTDVVTNGVTISNMTIGDGKVVESKIATGAVTEGKISESAITTSKIKNESITLEKLVKDGIIKVEGDTLVIFPED